MTTPIQSRLVAQYETMYNAASHKYITVALVLLDGEIFHRVEYIHVGTSIANPRYDLVPRDVAQVALEHVLQEWKPCQESTLNSEPKYRKTVISENGRVTVRESLY